MSNLASLLVDTNVLLRLFASGDELSELAVTAMSLLQEQEADLCIAPQNLVEFWAVATRPANKNGLGMTPRSAANEIRELRSFLRLLEGQSGIADSWQDLVLKYRVLGKQTHDAHLVAAMSVYGVDRILTFNGDHFQRFPSVEVISPASILAS